MATKVYIGGELFDQDQAQVSVFDRGFLFGDSVYETMRTSGGRPVDLEPHLARLQRSASAIRLPLPGPEELTSAIETTLAAAANDESSIRVVVTRGGGEIGLDTELAGEPTVIVIVRGLKLPPATFYERGAKVAIVAVQRTPKRAFDPAIKSGNYLNNIMALAEARRDGAHEAVMCDAEGRVAEGSTSNIFAVSAGVITTPPLHVGLLPGITRDCVLRLAGEAGIDTREDELTPADLETADEVFITSSIRGVLPISEVGERLLPAPGPVTSRIMMLYRSHLDSHTRG